MRRSSAQQDQSDLVNALLISVARGDCRAFERLYTEMAERVLFFVQHRLRDRAQSEEVTQEVFLEIWQQAPRFDAARGTAVTWIMTMAGRRAIDRIRAAQASRDRDRFVASRSGEVAHDQVIEAVEARDARNTVHAALTQITPLQREAVTLAHLQGFTIAETAALVGASESAVKTRVRDGVRALREVLDDREPGAAA